MKVSWEDEKRHAYATTADELIIRIIRGTLDLRIGEKNAQLFPRLHLFLFQHDAGKTAREKIKSLWNTAKFWGGENKNVSFNIDSNIGFLVDTAVNTLNGKKLPTLPKKQTHEFYFDEILNSKSPKINIMGKNVFQYSIKNSFWEVHSKYVKFKNLKTANKICGDAAKKIQEGLLKSINGLIKVYIEKHAKNEKNYDWGGEDMGDENKIKIENLIEKLRTEPDNGIVYTSVKPNVPYNIDPNIARKEGGLDAQQIVSCSPAIRQNEVHEDISGSEADCKINWSAQKNSNGFRCTFCWREKCREKGDNPTKAHSQRFDRPDTVTYAYWICKKYGLKSRTHYQNILKIIHKPIGILKLAGQCHPVYDSLGYPVKMFFSPGFYDELNDFQKYEIPDRSYMWVKKIKNFTTKTPKTWQKYISSITNIKNKLKETNTKEKKSSGNNSSSNRDFDTVDVNKTLGEILFEYEPRDKRNVIVPFQDYSLSTIKNLLPKLVNLKSKEKKDNGKYIYEINFYHFCVACKYFHTEKFFDSKISEKILNDIIDFETYPENFFNREWKNNNGILELSRLYTDDNLINKLIQKINKINEEYQEGNFKDYTIGVPNELKMFTSNQVGAVPVTDDNCERVDNNVEGEITEDAFLLAGKTTARESILNFKGWPEPFNRAIIIVDHDTYQNAIEDDLANRSNNTSVDFIKSYNPFNLTFQKLVRPINVQRNSSLSQRISVYHRSNDCSDLKNILEEWWKNSIFKNDKNQITPSTIESIFHIAMFHGLDTLCNSNETGRTFPPEFKQLNLISPWLPTISRFLSAKSISTGANMLLRIDGNMLTNTIDIYSLNSIRYIRSYLIQHTKWIFDTTKILIPFASSGQYSKYSEEMLRKMDDFNDFFDHEFINMFTKIIQYAREKEELPNLYLSILYGICKNKNGCATFIPIESELDDEDTISGYIDNNKLMTMISGLMANYFFDFLYSEIKAKNTNTDDKVIKDFIKVLYAEIKNQINPESLKNAVKSVLENREAINDNTLSTNKFSELFHVKLKF